MAAVERYLRSTVHRQTLEIVAGLEWRDDDDFDQVRAALKCRLVFTSARHALDGDDVVVKAVEETIRKYWPDRAFFIEVGDPDGDDWVQVFQPWGLPREANNG